MVLRDSLQRPTASPGWERFGPLHRLKVNDPE